MCQIQWMRAKWLIAIPAFASAAIWDYCALICTNAELGEPSRLGHLAGATAVFALLLSGSVGIWVACLKRTPPQTLAFVAGAVAALLLGPALTLAHSPAALVSFEWGSVEGAVVSLTGMALMLRALLRERPIVVQS